MSPNSSYTRRDMRQALLLVVLFATLAFAARANADTWHDALPHAQEVGSGDFRWYGFSIYSARLWSERRPFDATAPFALELTYHRAISRERLVQTSIDEIKRLYGDSLPSDTLQHWRDDMSQAFRDVSPDDRLIGVFLPSQGCRFYNQKDWIADIPDPEFAKALYSNWLDPRSRDAKLRAQLLGADQ